MGRAARRADSIAEAFAPRLDLEDGGHMDPVQTKFLFLMTLTCLLFAAQLMTQTGAFAALP
jgi:hypothetical protein